MMKKHIELINPKMYSTLLFWIISHTIYSGISRCPMYYRASTHPWLWLYLHHIFLINMGKDPHVRYKFDLLRPTVSCIHHIMLYTLDSPHMHIGHYQIFWALYARVLVAKRYLHSIFLHPWDKINQLNSLEHCLSYGRCQ